MIDEALVRRLLAEPDDAVTALHAAQALNAAGLSELIGHAGRLAGSEPGSAISLLDIADVAVTFAAAEPVEPASRYLRARLTLEAGRPAEALPLIASSREAYDRLGLYGEGLRTELGRMHALDDLGRHDEAAEVGRALLAGLDRLSRDDAGAAGPGEDLRRLRASGLGNLGVALGFTGRHSDALWCYARSEAIWSRLGEEEAAAAARANQGIELIALGRAPAALSRLGAAAEVFDAAGDRFWHAKCLGHRAEALLALARYGDALDDLRVARQDLHAQGARTEEWRAVIDTASVLLALGLADEADVVLEQVVPQLRAAGVKHDLAAALLVRGMALAKTRRRAAARSMLTESARIFQEVGDPANQARGWLELSRLVPRAPALRLAGDAALLVRTRSWPGTACLVALGLAELYHDDPQRAAAHLAEAARIADERALPHLRQTVDLRRGILRLREHDLDGGIAFLDRSLLEAERIGVGIRDEGLRTAYVSGLAAATDHLVGALLDRDAPGDLPRAAALSDRAKGGTLADVLRGAVSRSSGAPDGETGRLVAELEAAYSTLFAAPAAAERALRARVEELERRVAVAQALAPGAALAARPRPAATLPAAVSSVAYHVSNDEVVAFVTVDGVLHARRRVTATGRLLRLLDDLDGHLGPHAVPALAEHALARTGACRAVLQQLYLAVLAPVLDLLPAGASPAPLVVVPHGPLHRVPFQALHDGRDYVLADWVISVSPSLEVAASALGRTPRPGPALVLGVADDTTPFVEEEARRVADVLGGSRLFVGPGATFENLREHAGRAGLVHLACHGLFRPDNVAFTSLRLADRWARAADVADLDLDGAVLVLSACETGRVGGGSASDAAALAHGFLAAGARSVIVSRWLADDRWTAELMTCMHRQIAAGDDPPSALRAAQLAVLEERPHPFYWAPFTALGAPSSPSKETV